MQLAVAATTTMTIDRTSKSSEGLFQTERYGDQTSFGYTIDTPADGLYTLVLRFSEVYFTGPNMKVFDVKLDNSVTVAKDIDIYAAAGRFTATDHTVEFTIKDSSVVYQGTTHSVGDTLTIDFVKGKADNAKVCAILLVKGDKATALALATLEDPTSEEAPDVDVDEYAEDDVAFEEETEGDVEEAPVVETEDVADDQGGVPIIPVIFAVLAALGIGQLRNQL
jgi:hypothetical protein